MLKIGVIGAGHWGKIHINCIKQIPTYNLIGFHDADLDSAKKVAKEVKSKHFNDLDDLLEDVDVVNIVTPSLPHYDLAVKAIRKSKHVFIEKPISNTITEAKNIMDLALEANVKVQVGHSERFNPAFLSALPYINKPMFIESHRLSAFNPNENNNSVILDLMIHDIYIVLNMIKSSVKRISATGLTVFSETPDIANARIEFDNGCVANLTASKIALKNSHKTRVYQKDAYLNIDFFNQQTKLIDNKCKNLSEIIINNFNDSVSSTITQLRPKSNEKKNNTIKKELESFQSCILNNTYPEVTIEDGYLALSVAHQIIEKLKLTTNFSDFENKMQ